MLSVVALVFVFAVAVLAAKKLLERKNQANSKFQTPPEHVLFGHALYLINKEKVLPNLQRLMAAHGETIRINIGPLKRMIFTSDPRFIDFILRSPAIQNKSQDYNKLGRWLGDGLLTSAGGARWRGHRRILTPAFHTRILEKFVPVIESNAAVFIGKLHEADGGADVDISPFVTLLSLDIICETAMGTSVSAQTNATSDYVHSVKEMCRILIERAFSPLKNSEFLYQLSGDYAKEKRALKTLHGYTDSVISSKMELVGRGGEKGGGGGMEAARRRLALLDLLLEETLDQHFTLDDVKKEVNTFLFAGHDTTAVAIKFAIHCLAHHPHVQEKAFEEQESIFKGDLRRSLTADDIKQMKYLDLVVKETLRMYPSVPLIAREATEAVVYEGEAIPKGQQITMCLYVLQRNPKYFENPERFDPDRFEQSENGEKGTYIPFSAGPRNCIGQKFAMLEVKAVLSLLLRHFTILPSMTAKPLVLSSEVVLNSENGINVRLLDR